MQQLTKDPQGVLNGENCTLSSPQRKMTAFELNRYLDFCSELLSMLGKISALYVQNFTDPVVVTAGNEIEVLATGLSRKVWQKIMILKSYES